MKFNIPRDCCRWSCVPPRLNGTKSGARHRRCCQRPPPVKALKGPWTQQHFSKLIKMQSSLCAQPLSVWRWWTPSSKTDPNSQRRLRHTPEGISWVAASRTWGTWPAFPCTHSQQTGRMCREAHVNHQPEQQATLRYQQHSEGAQEQQRHDWPLHCICSVQPHTLYGTCPGPTSERKQEWLLTPPQSQHWTGHTTSPSSQHVARSAQAFRSAKLTANKIPVMKTCTKNVILRNGYVPIRIWYGKDTDTNQYFIARPADFDVHAAGC